MIRRFTQNGENGNRRGSTLPAIVCILVILLIFRSSAAGSSVWTVTAEASQAAAEEQPVKAPELSTPADLRVYLQGCLGAGQRDCTFIYTGPREDLEGQYLTRMTNALYCSVRFEETGESRSGDTGGFLCEVKLSPHTGEAVIEAWRAGDLSGLSEEETALLEQALGIVDYLRMEEGLLPLYDDDEGADSGEDEDKTEPVGETGTSEDEDPEEDLRNRKEYLSQLLQKAASRSPEETGIGVELRIHDWLCEQVDYVRDVPEIKDPSDIAPEYTVAGALREGRANCQGYADAFYLLGSLAGYEVGFQSADVRESGTGHVFNTIRLGKNWYAVDVTGDDNAMKSGDEILQDYHLFNAGMDIVGTEFTWPSDLVIRPLAEKSDHYYYYYWDKETGTDGEVRCFDSAAGVAEAAVRHYQEGGEAPAYYLWLGHEDSGKELDAALFKALSEEKKEKTYRYHLIHRGGSTYYRVIIE